ncbi:putative bifunctional diguanylate cyclase/phosphodiesterase [Sphingorhabdus sp.]|uniref:putative bifunctional diguanylate cyclase/phosphodiesterase n=1 Tax=Sphingorhabdus sp. TaxID=1902408 RepID=UPI00391C5C98
MIKKDASFELPTELSYKALLGLAEPTGLDGDVLRTIQARKIRQRTSLRVALNLTFAILALLLYRGTAPAWAMISWASLFCGFHIVAFYQFGGKWVWDRPQYNRDDVRRLNTHSAVTGLMWGAVFGLLGTSGSIMEVLGLWSIVLGMMVYSSLLLPTAPMAATIFIGVTSLCASLGFAFHGGYYLAVAAIGIGALLVMACLQSARAQILYEVANSIVQEKSETVSLLLREFEDSGADWLWQTDVARCATHVSPRFAYALGTDTKSVEGQPLLKLIAGDAWELGQYPAELHELADRLKRRESFSNLIVPVMFKGVQRWWELSASPRHSEDGSFLGFRGVGSDVTEQRESANKISHLARFDTLTGLPNRLLLTETLANALADADKWRRRCGFLMIDLDRFKAVNDTLGHPVGDRLLAQVARRLKLIMTDNELCGRLGGDEFAVVINDASDTNYVATLSGRIIESLSRPYEVDQNTLFIGASVGSALGPVDGRTVELLMRSADLALYRSKDQGGNMHHSYQHKLHANAEERRLMEFELRAALEREQFHVEYQPVVTARGDNTLVGFEALLRWVNPKFGNVSPAKFIPVAEDARLIVAIGDFILRRACKDAMSWPETTCIAVNISVDQLTSANFVETVMSALQDSGLSPHRLELEVTESIFLRDGTMAVQVLDRIRSLGVKLSLDDFGTGYSSLGYLRNVRFDTIKVDRSFVQGAAKNKAESLAIIRAVVALADSLNIATTAEGVETEGELVMVQQLGCKKIQGYYFGRPMVFADSLELFKRPRSAVA